MKEINLRDYYPFYTSDVIVEVPDPSRCRPIRPQPDVRAGTAGIPHLFSHECAGLVGVMYVLDEPSIGLHQRDNERLLGAGV